MLRHAEEVSGNVAATCRYYGISRTVFYKRRNRYEQLGLDGLRDRSTRPHHSPTATKGEVVERIVHLRQSYHFGPTRIAMYLKRYHDVEISPSGVWRILHRLGLGRLPANQRWKRYEKQRPGHRVQIDVKFIAPINGVTTKRHYQFTAIDDCTRLRVLRIYPKADQRTAIMFLDYVTERLPFPIEVIQTDNGAEFQTGFHWHVLDADMRAHAQVEDTIARLKDSGLDKMPFRAWTANAAWTALCVISLALVSWFQALRLTGTLAKAAPKRLRWQLWHTPARIVRTARRTTARLPDHHPGTPALLAAAHT